MLPWSPPPLHSVDRLAVLLSLDQCTVRDMDRGVIRALMRWWVSRASLHVQALIQQHCWYCGQLHEPRTHRLSADHAFPQYYASTPLVPCCRPCNSQKRHLTPQQYRRFHPRGVFWFEWSDLALSPLGCALREDVRGFRTLLTAYLIARHSGVDIT